MIRYQQKNPTMGMRIGAVAQGVQTGRQVGNMAVSAAGRLDAPAYGAGQLAGRGVRGLANSRLANALPSARTDLPGARTAAFYGNRYNFNAPAGFGTQEQMDIMRAQRLQGARIRENRSQVRLGAVPRHGASDGRGDG